MFRDPNTYLVLMGMLLFGIVYAYLVRHIRLRDPEHGYTAFLVVGGNAGVVIGFTLLVGLELGALLFALMAFAGVPMIYEFADWYLGRTEKLRQQQDQAKFLRDVWRRDTDEDSA